MSKKLGIFAIVLSFVAIACSLFTMGYCLKLFEFGEEKKEENRAGVTDSLQYVMYVGTNDKDTNQLEMTKEEAWNLVDEVCLKYLRGYTIEDATGSWVEDTGVLYHEYTLVCYFDNPEPEDVYKAADELLERLNQNTILIETKDVKVEYYGGGY